MIFDKTENISDYFAVLPELREVEKFVDSFVKGEKENKRYDIDGENLFVSPSTYVSKEHEGAEYESHNKYIDVQVVTEGREYIGWAPTSDCKVTKPFENGGDIAFYTSDKGSLCKVNAGYFMVLFPQDAHMPCLKVGDNEQVTKLVFKIKIKK